MASQGDIVYGLIQGEHGQGVADELGWKLENKVCEWQGIDCDSIGHVTRISLTGHPLQASLPSEIGRLTKLEELVLEDCYIHGTVPSEIASLTTLKVVDLSFNSISGNVPVWSSKLLTLQSMASNFLTGTIPEEAGTNSPNLVTMDYKMNFLTGTVPHFDRRGLTNLRQLDISKNELSGRLSPTISQLPSLERLYLQGNQFTGRIVNNFSGGSFLKEIWLSDNQLTGTLPPSLSLLPHLTQLLINGNRLTGTIPHDLCGRNLNDILFDDSVEVVVGDKPRNPGGPPRKDLRQLSRRDGCTSIACPAGSSSVSDTGRFPCTPCDVEVMNPYLGAATCTNTTQGEILHLLYNQTGGDTWIGAGIESWADPSIPVCAKSGVICTDEGIVSRLSLPARNLTGTIPLELGFLTGLEGLDLSHNRLTGHLPEELAIPPLVRLDVSENLLTGYVPDSLCNKAGLNGNGEDGIFDCNIITCAMGTYHPEGRADPGGEGEGCMECDLVDGHVLGNTNCGTSMTTRIPPDSEGTNGPQVAKGNSKWSDGIIVATMALIIVFTGLYLLKRMQRYRYKRTAPDMYAKEDNMAPRANNDDANEPDLELVDVPLSTRSEWKPDDQETKRSWVTLSTY